MSEKTVAAKLLIKPGTAIWTSRPDRLALVGELPGGAAVVASAGEAAVALGFVDDAAGARAALDTHAAGPAREGVTISACYPKANKTDINRDTLWPIFMEYRLRPNGVAALDATWSAMRYRALKAGETFHGLGSGRAPRAPLERDGFARVEVPRVRLLQRLPRVCTEEDDLEGLVIVPIPVRLLPIGICSERPADVGAELVEVDERALAQVVDDEEVLDGHESGSGVEVRAHGLSKDSHPCFEERIGRFAVIFPSETIRGDGEVFEELRGSLVVLERVAGSIAPDFDRML